MEDMGAHSDHVKTAGATSPATGATLLRCIGASSMFRRMTDSACIVLCTFPDADGAQAAAGALVGDRLAACVNLLPGVTSVYRWEGEVHTDREALLVAKTSRRALAALEARILELHPYDVPEIVAVDITAGLPAYLQWVDTCVTA
jgi:periplasmic divalent cation tolerance protein